MENLSKECIKQNQYKGITLLLAACLLLVTACRLLPSLIEDERGLPSYDPAMINTSLNYKGVERQILLYVPNPLPESGVPLVIMLHSEGSTPEGAMLATTEGRWNELAFRDKFIVVYPQAWRGYWNDCRVMDGNAHEDANDVGFILAVIDWVRGEYPIDRESVFLAGHSNGGMMALRLALEAPERFAAIFANNALLPVESECSPSGGKTSLMLLLGTEDPLMPYSGGSVGLEGTSSGLVLSADETAAAWLKMMALTSDPEITELADREGQDRSTVTRLAYEDEQILFWIYRVNGGGHAWPGEEPFSRLEEQTNGSKNRDVQGADAAWQFFQESLEK